MIIYTCHKCNKKFYNKTDFRRHMNRKFTCELKNDISGKNISI